MSRSTNLRGLFAPKPLGASTTSLEEDAVLIAGAADDLQRINTEINEVKRLEDTAETLRDVALVTANVESASVHDLFTLESAARLAIAGSDISTRLVTPALERYEGKRVNLEGLMDFIDSIWRAIVDAMKSVWNAVNDFFYKIFGTIPRLRRNIEEIQEKAEKGNDLLMEAKVKLGPELGIHMRNDKLPTRADELFNGVDILYQHVEFYLADYVKIAAEVYKDFGTEMVSFNEDRLEESLNALSDVAIHLSARYSPGELRLTEVKDPRFAPGEYVNLPHLPGNKTFYIRRVTIPNADKALERAEAIQSCVVKMMDSKPRVKSTVASSGEIETPSNNDIMQLCTMMLNILDTVEKYGRGKDFIQIKKSKDELLKISDDLVSRSRDLPRDSRAIPYYRSAIRFNSYMTTTVVQPLTNLCSLALLVVRSTVVICQKSLGISTFF